MKFVDVYNRVIAAMMLSEGFTYLYRKDDDPYRFIGDEAAARALYWEKFIDTEIPIKLTVKEAFVLGKMLEDIPLYNYYYGINGCGDKLIKAVFDKNT